jgi:hypothetical protein
MCLRYSQEQYCLALLPLRQTCQGPTRQLLRRTHRRTLFCSIGTLGGGGVGVHGDDSARAKIANGALNVVSTGNVSGEVGIGLLMGGERWEGRLCSLPGGHGVVFG